MVTPFSPGGYIPGPIRFYYEQAPQQPKPETIKGDMYGYRSWAVLDDELYSLVNDTVRPWPAGKNTAKCTVSHWQSEPPRHPDPRHKSPATGCHCGYFGYWEDSRMISNGGGEVHKSLFQNMDIHGAITVSGVIRASGDVIMHEFGFRAEYVEVMALAPMPHDDYNDCPDCIPFGYLMPDILLGLSKRYQVPTFTKWSDLYREYPPTNKCEPKERNHWYG